MHFEHLNDIDPEGTFDCRSLDALLNVVLSRTERVLSKTPRVGQQLLPLMNGLFRAFSITHKSIRSLMRTIGDPQALTSDGVSLAREQIEKVFTISLLLEEDRKSVV